MNFMQETVLIVIHTNSRMTNTSATIQPRFFGAGGIGTHMPCPATPCAA